MGFIPAELAYEGELTLANKLREALTKYCTMQGENFAFYKGEVMPIIRQMCKSGIATSTEEAIFLTGEFVMEKGTICFADMTTEAILQRAACGTIRIASSTMACASIVGFVLMLTVAASASESDPDNKNAYKKYVKKYMTYLLKAAKLGGNQLQHMPPPMKYEQYIKKLQTTDWMGNNISDQTAWWQY